MPFSAEISRVNPSCFVFIVDQSGSMIDAFGGSNASNRSKAEEVADVLNRLLQTLITRCAHGDDVRDYFEIGVFGYGHSNGPILQGPLKDRDFVPISDIACNPVSIEDRTKKVPDGAGGLTEQTFKFPKWITPAHKGGTPMCKALEQVGSALDKWLASHRSSYPPTIIHITDGESTDGDPSAAAAHVRARATDDGPVSLFNVHISADSGSPITFPASKNGLPDQFAQLLFDMSSTLPEHMVKEAASEGYTVAPDSRGFAFNADLVETIRFVDIGTRVSNLR